VDITPAETKAIAEEGFIYGLPIVMNYAVMYEYAVDRDSGQMSKSCGTFAEVLKQNGYNTAWYGKNHNIPDWHSSQAGPFGTRARREDRVS
jgi:arylsulfatase A-like enzyme